MEHDFLWTAGEILSEMRLIVEGALVLFEEDSSVFLAIAQKEQKHEATITLNTIGMALNCLRNHICDLEKAHMEAVLHEGEQA